MKEPTSLLGAAELNLRIGRFLSRSLFYRSVPGRPDVDHPKKDISFRRDLFRRNLLLEYNFFPCLSKLAVSLFGVGTNNRLLDPREIPNALVVRADLFPALFTKGVGALVPLL